MRDRRDDGLVSRTRREVFGCRRSTLEYFARATGGEKFLIETASASAGDFLKRVINSHRSISVESATNAGKVDLWFYFLLVSLIVFTVAILFY